MEINVDNINMFKINDFLHRTFECSCGRKHSVGIEKIIIENGAINKVPEVLKDFGFKRAYCVADTNTNATLESLEDIFDKTSISYVSHVFVRNGDLVPDEAAVGEFVIHMDKSADVLVAIGTGVLNDLCKYMSYKLNIPYIIIATAPSMDGFASDGSALIIDNLKTTLQTTMPKAIIGDVEILKSAPEQMIMAGFGDMLGKYSALNDWKLSNIINDEYYCSTIVKMVELSLESCIKNIKGLLNRSDEALKNLMEGLVLCGIAMSFTGNSRPASGSEHHLAHFWEMMFLFEGREPVLHGIKVGINTLTTNVIREQLSNEKPDFEQIRKEAHDFDHKKWLEDVNKIYSKAAPGIIKLDREVRINSLDERQKRLNKIEDNWETIVKTLKEVPPTEEIQKVLKAVGLPVRAEEVGVDTVTVKQGLVYAKEVRARYTVLQLLWDLGLLNDYAAIIK